MADHITTPDAVKVNPEQGLVLNHSGIANPSINPKKYAVILLDKDGNVKARLEHVASRIKWAWLTKGGCGRCSFTLPGTYNRVIIRPDDEIQIWLPNTDGTATKVYSGYAQDVVPTIAGGADQKIAGNFGGFGYQLNRLIVHNSGDVKTYQNTSVSDIVSDIIDTYVVPYGSITKGTIDTSLYTPDAIDFKGTVSEALKTLSGLEDVEYGVDADKVFFWRNRSSTLSHKFFLGAGVTLLEDRAEYDDIRNAIYLEGGDVAGSAYILSASSSRSIETYKRRERIEANGSITTNSVGVRYLSRLLKKEAKPKIQRRVRVTNTKKRLEMTLPVGTVAVVDPDEAGSASVYGTTGNGGSNILYGTIANGGSGQRYGGDRSDFVFRLDYELSPEVGRHNVTIQFADSKGYSMASAALKRIETELSATRQRQL